MNQEITPDPLFGLYIACVLASLKCLKANKEKVYRAIKSVVKRGEVYGYFREKVLEMIQNELNNL